MRKTNANRLLKAITNNLVSVTSAVVNHDEGMKEPISVEKFKEDLEFYVNSGIFADTIDFTYEKLQKIGCSFPSEKQVVTAMTI